MTNLHKYKCLAMQPEYRSVINNGAGHKLHYEANVLFYLATGMALTPLKKIRDKKTEYS